MTIVKAIILQGFWYLSVSCGYEYEIPILVSAILLSLANFFIYRPSITKGHYLFCVLFFVLYGFIQENLFEQLGLVDYGQESFPLWLTALYIVFIGYYGDLLNYLSKKPLPILAIVGALGGVSSYYGGAIISKIEVLSPFYYLALALGWGLFFPLSIKIFYEGLLWNKFSNLFSYRG